MIYAKLLFELGLSAYKEERFLIKLESQNHLFLLSQTKPNYDYLTQKQHIHNPTELKTKLIETTEKTDLLHKSKDFEHLLFNQENKDKILNFSEFIKKLN